MSISQPPQTQQPQSIPAHFPVKEAKEAVNSQPAVPISTMSPDNTLTQVHKLSYFAGLDCLLDGKASPDSVTFFKSASSKASQKNADLDSSQSEPAVGLGLFAPRKFMSRLGDQGSGDGQHQQEQPKIEAVRAIADLLNAQAIAEANNALRVPVVALRKDSVAFVGVTPSECKNTFNDLMATTAFLLMQELTHAAEQSGISSTSPSKLLAQVPNVGKGGAPNTESIIGMLESAVSLRLLQQKLDARPQDEATTGVIDAASLVLRSLLSKIQDGGIDSNPAAMATIIENLKEALATNPQLAGSGIVERLEKMTQTIANVQSEKPVTETNDESQSTSQDGELSRKTSAGSGDAEPEIKGWTSGGDGTLSPNTPQVLEHPKEFSTVASGSVDENGIFSGVGFGGKKHATFAYQLTPNDRGDITLLDTQSGQGKKSSGFTATAKMALDDQGNSVSLSEGALSWNGGKESIRMNSDGFAELTQDGGHTWKTSPDGGNFSYTSNDGRSEVAFNAITNKVQFVSRDDENNVTGKATMQATADGLTFSHLSAETNAKIG